MKQYDTKEITFSIPFAILIAVYATVTGKWYDCMPYMLMFYLVRI